MSDVILLTGDNCSACKMLKDRLKKEEIYEGLIEMNVHHNSSAKSMMLSLGLRGIPVLIKNGKETMIGASHPIAKYKEFIEE